MEGKDFRFSTLIRPMKAAAIPTIMTRIPEAETRNKRESGTYTRKAKLFQKYTEMVRKWKTHLMLGILIKTTVTKI